VSIINEALRKTQQSRKIVKEKRVTEKVKPAQTAAPMAARKAVAKQSEPKKSLSFPVNVRTASLLTVTTLLVIMAYDHYQRLIPPEKATKPDPIMQVVAKPNAPKSKVTFEGVFLTDNENIAFINKQSLKLGDTINGMRIVAITRDTVDLQSNQGVLRIKAGATYLL